MSQLSNAARSARPAIAAVERARLALVPVRRANAPRAPFAVLVSLILGAGVVGLLMFNTQMQQDSFYATKLQHQADTLTAQRESLQLELDSRRDPQRLGQAARRLGMVQPSVPAFIDLATGRIVGEPTPATREDGVPITPRTTSWRAPFVPRPKVVEVTAKTPATDGPASVGTGATAGKKGTGTAAQGAPR